MAYAIAEREEEGGHTWVVATANCRLEDSDDGLVAETAALVRRSYGELEIMAEAERIMASEIENGSFRTDHLLAAIREGLPDPDAEGDKPPQLTTYRSQSAEMVAKAALAGAYQFEYPAAPQAGSTNANQPVLGFDGWGILRRADGTYSLVLVQVKATDDDSCPPPDAHKLAEECRQIPRDRSKLSRALSVLVLLLRNDPLAGAVLGMLALLGNSRLPDMHVAPAIVRGRRAAGMGDIQPVRAAAADFAPATARGIVVGIGVPLANFGEAVMRKAREPR